MTLEEDSNSSCSSEGSRVLCPQTGVFYKAHTNHINPLKETNQREEVSNRLLAVADQSQMSTCPISSQVQTSSLPEALLNTAARDVLEPTSSNESNTYDPNEVTILHSDIGISRRKKSNSLDSVGRNSKSIQSRTNRLEKSPRIAIQRKKLHEESPKIVLEQITGFEQGLIAKEIVGTKDSERGIFYLVKWTSHNKEPELIPALHTYRYVPALVIQFYANRLAWISGEYPAPFGG